MKTTYWTRVSEFDGLPKESDYKIVEEDISEDLKPGEMLTEALVISVDPYTRVFPAFPGSPVLAFQASRVIKSASEKYPKGCIVMFHGGWKSICKTTDEDIWTRVDNIKPKVKTTHAIGILGMPGISSYVGLLKYCKPKEGETIFVNGSAGAVGSLVGQIAKIKGCKVVGCCGTDEKVEFVKSIGFDDVFNYKTEKSWPEALKRIAPNGIDCFFDNIGGQMSSDVMYHMNKGGRVTICGSISSYNSTSKPKADIIQPAVLRFGLTINSFMSLDGNFRPNIPTEEAVKDLPQWISEGKIVARETITDGFENLPKAFVNIFSGKHIGKAVVQVST